MTSSGHFPVMLPEVLQTLCPQDGETYVDGTFGAGGYTRAILESAGCNVIAIDRDEDAKNRAQKFKEEFGDRFTFVQGVFGDVRSHLDDLSIDKVDGFVLDIGVSSFQIDEADRGFSFRFDGPLDMRMQRGSDLSAADIVNTYPEEKLANIIYQYGEERLSRRIAKSICARRYEQKFETTFDLADIVRSCVPKGKDKIDPATRTFQALRIAVNDELGELERALASSPEILSENGRLVVVTFHSLEDRIVKRFMREQSGRITSASRHLPDIADHKAATFEIVTRKALEASKEETAINSRSRSAKLRAAKRIGGAA